eukprot:CAMPEP_0172440290 /NCGR_PEP_ID=MMETSP1065-20121228/962_1 /TAXON_ID=265537 /ORGANISM="Amphiprora paludosa, Strain CCMP125" /LENGTH=626 /DNA_ID=CAMNT_0013189077 /DNA_START=136 /DNA_END=2016 /DNA_ORIENTATION=-
MVAFASGAAATGGSRRSNNSNKPSGGQGSSKNSKQKHSLSSGNANTQSFLLARGWTSRLALPSILPPLRGDEMEKDLRHMQVYGNAVQSYQQQFYIQTNRMTMVQGENGTPSPLPAHSAANPPVVTSIPLPVRIDPEEEKRLFNLRKKIAAAEVLREQAEQEWVANQAHYVHMAALLREAQQKRKDTVAFLQKAVKTRASVTAQARLRLQMTRDIYNSLQYRISKLQPTDQVKGGGGDAMENSDPADNANTPAADVPKPTGQPQEPSTVETATETNGNTPAATEDLLTELWISAEEDYKRACLKMMGANEKSKKKNSQNAVINWSGTHLATTPSEVPLFVSVLSNIPDKTLAYGPDPYNMIWIPSNLSDKPNDAVHDSVVQDDENEDWLMHDGNPDEKALENRVKQLEKELVHERKMNTEWSSRIAASRKVNDEWVAMMSLVRQETEALLHRHNILLESDMALTASEQIHEQEMQEKAEAAAVQAAKDKEELAAVTSGEEKTSPSSGLESSVGQEGASSAISAPATAKPSDETEPTASPSAVATGNATNGLKAPEGTANDEAANDGDDEGSGGAEEEEKDEWAASTTAVAAAVPEPTVASEISDSNKRPPEAETEDKNEAKRRKVE